jgi:hypothetical protein
MPFYSKTIEVLDLCDDCADHSKSLLTGIVFGLLGPEGKDWMVFSRNEEITFYFARLTDLRRFEMRINELELDPQTDEVCACTSNPCSCFVCEEVGHA